MESLNQNALDALEVVREFLKKGNWQAEQIDGRSAYQAEGEDEWCPRNYFFQIVEQEQFLFYIQPVITLLPEMLPAVAEFVARANFGMRIGNFELDYQECKVCFRSSINFNGSRLTEPLVRGVVEPALTAYDEFFPGVISVIAGTKSPLAAIQDIEYGPDDESTPS